MAPHSSTLAWKIPWTEEPGRLQSMGSLRVGHDWATSLSLFTFMHWRRKWQPTRGLAWRIPGMGEPGGLLSMGSHRVRHDWSDLAAVSTMSTVGFCRFSLSSWGSSLIFLVFRVSLMDGVEFFLTFFFSAWIEMTMFLFFVLLIRFVINTWSDFEMVDYSCIHEISPTWS